MNVIFHRINHINQDGKVTGGFLIPGEIPVEYVQKLVDELRRRPLGHEIPRIQAAEEYG